MSTFVLIHGGFHGGWCWYKVVAALERKGHTVLAPDLPGHGRDRTPLADVTMQAYADCICALLDVQNEPVVLVGHSMGGGPITLAGEARPNKIRQLVYLTAILPRNGETLAEIVQQDARSVALANFVLSDDGKYATFREEGLKEALYGDCSDEDIALARLSLTPQSLQPRNHVIATSVERYGSVPRVYIECRRDRAQTLEAQRRAYSAVPCERVISLDTSHSPFFSTPDELTDHLAEL